MILLFNKNILIVYGILVANTIVIETKKELLIIIVVYKLIKPEATIDDVKKKKNNTIRSNFRKELKKVHDSKRNGSTMLKSLL
jgi:hypothetical protein